MGTAEFDCCVAKWATSREVALTFGTIKQISLWSGRLVLASLNTTVQPLSAYVCGVYNNGVTNVPFAPVFGRW